MSGSDCSWGVLETPLDPGQPWKTPGQKWIKGTCRRTEREAEEARTWEYRLNRLVTLTAKAFPYLRWEEREAECGK